MQRHFELTQHNSFAFPAVCPEFYQPTSIKELSETLSQIVSPFYILGEGSNTLFSESSTPPIIQPNIKGISIIEENETVLVSAKCGENWHQLVKFCVDKNFYGIENLALIPGSVGAAPVQNIGAYGAELSDVVDNVKWYEFSSQKIKILDNKACEFTYRDSVFKKLLAGKGLIVEVTLRLFKKWQANLSYHGLNALPVNASSKDVFQKVIDIRQSKLPDPKRLPNAGSFFKNPVITQDEYERLKKCYSEIPAYPQANNQMKLAAGWLIEKAGLKGLKQGGVGVDKNQALVLVNYESTQGQDIIDLAEYVQNSVNNKFEILLQVEVRVLSSVGLAQIGQGI
jgi:UDP-N-acetylmuramate dehydrogenase